MMKKTIVLLAIVFLATMVSASIIVGAIQGPIKDVGEPIPCPNRICSTNTIQPIQTGTGGGSTWGLSMVFPGCSKKIVTGNIVRTFVYKGNACWKEIEKLNPTLLEQISKANRFERTSWENKGAK